jgi:hypothetical protein
LSALFTSSGSWKRMTSIRLPLFFFFLSSLQRNPQTALGTLLYHLLFTISLATTIFKMAFTSATSATIVKSRAYRSGSKTPLPPPSLQRARHTPAALPSVADAHNGNMTKSSRLPTRLAPVRAPNVSSVPLTPSRPAHSLQMST